jgi:hypothetical protein
MAPSFCEFMMRYADDPNHDDVRHQALWGHLMGGGAGCEWYFGYKFAHNDLGLEDFRATASPTSSSSTTWE